VIVIVVLYSLASYLPIIGIDLCEVFFTSYSIFVVSITSLSWFKYYPISYIFGSYI